MAGRHRADPAFRAIPLFTMNVWLIVHRVSCAVLASVVIVALAGVFMPKIREHEALRKRSDALEEEIRVKSDMTRELRYRQERFRSDPGYVERVAREKLGKAKPGEIIFRFAEPETNAVPGP